jgi:TPR repeat protein
MRDSNDPFFAAAGADFKGLELYRLAKEHLRRQHGTRSRSEKKALRDEALRLFHLSAQQGSVLAQLELADIFMPLPAWQDKYSIVQDVEQAIKWYRRAATHRGPEGLEAEFLLGILYFNGKHVDKDVDLAMASFRRAAKGGHLNAQKTLAHLLKGQSGVDRGDIEAVSLHTAMAERKRKSTQDLFGNSGYKGEKKSLPKHSSYLREVSSPLIASEQFDIGCAFGSCTIGWGTDTERAELWYMRSAKQGYAPAQFNLAMLIVGERGKSDFEHAIEWYRRAADQGDVWAMHRLGDLYMDARFDRNEDKAIGWWTLAADIGCVWSQFALSECYLGRHGGALRNGELEIKWLNQAAEQDHKTAQYRMARRFREGHGVPRDLRRARDWYLRAAEHSPVWNKRSFRFETALARIHLTKIYRDGDGVDENLQAAFFWASRTAAMSTSKVDEVAGIIREGSIIREDLRHQISPSDISRIEVELLEVGEEILAY